MNHAPLQKNRLVLLGRKLFGPETAESSGQRAWYSSLAISAVVHGCLLALLALFWFDATRPQDRTVLQTLWAAENPIVELTEVSQPLLLDPVEQSSKLPAELESSSARTTARRSLHVRPLSEQATVAAHGSGTSDGLDLMEHVAFLDDGQSSGTGDGNGSGFFGVEVKGRKFVYVVDCSTSMNQAHSDQRQSRFQRVKLEMVRSISKLDSSKQFFLIFFNDAAKPMPANSMQQASSSMKQEYLQWMAQIPAMGRTDPRDALELALRLRPDVIYFLTDGEFKPAIEADLRRLRQEKVAIHTYAFGTRYAEDVMKAVAEANGGIYKFIP